MELAIVAAGAILGGARLDHELTTDHADPNVAVRTSPAEAAAAWVEVAKLRTEGRKLVSPAIATDMVWLKEWFSMLPPEARPDYLSVHVYTTTFDSFRAKVTEYYQTFGLPIIVTEFAMTVSVLTFLREPANVD
jgi:hypothetical protein